MISDHKPCIASLSANNWGSLSSPLHTCCSRCFWRVQVTLWVGFGWGPLARPGCNYCMLSQIWWLWHHWSTGSTSASHPSGLLRQTCCAGQKNNIHWLSAQCCLLALQKRSAKTVGIRIPSFNFSANIPPIVDCNALTDRTKVLAKTECVWVCVCVCVRERERHTHTQRQRDRHRETQRDRDREAERERDRDRKTARHWERERETETERERERLCAIQGLLYSYITCTYWKLTFSTVNLVSKIPDVRTRHRRMSYRAKNKLMSSGVSQLTTNESKYLSMDFLTMGRFGRTRSVF